MLILKEIYIVLKEKQNYVATLKNLWFFLLMRIYGRAKENKGKINFVDKTNFKFIEC